MEYKDYYQVLGVPRGATQADVKKAYRRLARELHPDRNPGDAASEKRFKEANEAHAVLSDPAKRKRYDELGSNWQDHQPSGFGGAPGGMRWETRQVDPADLGGFSDFFRAFFSGATSGAARSALPTAEAVAEVTLAEVARGAERMVSVEGRRIQVKVPAGVENGARIRLRGAGLRGSDGAVGDLLITIRVLPDPRFERRGPDLATELPVTLAEALLGAEVPVPTPAGSVKLRIRPGTQNDQEIHLPGRGLPRRARGHASEGVPARGDLVVRVRVVLPTLDDEARTELGKVLGRHPQADPRSTGRVQ